MVHTYRERPNGHGHTDRWRWRGRFLTVADEISGRLYSAPWLQKQQQQELDAPLLPLTSSVSRSSVLFPGDAAVAAPSVLYGDA